MLVGLIDPSLGKPLEEKSYAVDCSLTFDNLKVIITLHDTFYLFILGTNGLFYYCTYLWMVRKDDSVARCLDLLDSFDNV